MKVFKTGIFYFSIGIFIILSLTTCKKYPEDKFISLRKSTKRINGSWKIKEYTFNGNDVIDIINAQTKTFDVRDLVLEVIMKDPYGYYDAPRYRFSPVNYLGSSNTSTGSPLIESNTRFHFQRGDSLVNFIFVTPLSFKGANYANWDIKHLYLSNMHLQLKTDSGNYDIHFKKQ